MASQSLTKPLIHDPAAESSSSSDSLRSVFGQRPQIGCALAGMLPGALGASEAELLGRHFDVVTPENCMKPEPIQPEEGVFHFDRPDALVRFARDRGLDVVGHCLVWHQQCPGWMFLDGDEPADRELVLRRMRDHIHTVVGRYRGQIRGWDVVNEAVAEPGEYLRETPWTQRVGEDFVAKAFEFAHEADPDAELYYNDFNIELPDKRERTLRLLRSLQAQGVRLDGVGIQGHWIMDQVPFQHIEDAILAYHELGLKVMVTELDLDVIDRPDCGADVSLHEAYTLEGDPYRDGCPDDVLERQAQQYAQLFELFHRHRDKVSRVTFWGLHDGGSWLNEWPGKRTNHPLLFDREAKPKPALSRIVQAVQEA